LFDSLSERLSGVLDRLTGRGALSEADVDMALREVRRALLEADVALDVVRSFVEHVKKNAVGVGLQGSGKTTTTAKIAKRLTEQGRRKVLMASLDTRRPAAMEQLAVLGQQVSVDTLPIVAGQH